MDNGRSARSKAIEAGYDPNENEPMMEYPPPIQNPETFNYNDQQMAQTEEPIEKMAADEAEPVMSVRPIGPMLWVGLGCNLFAMAAFIISFSSPFWLQTYPDSFNTFRNIGLWEACFQNYIHYKDDKQELYNGCWWILNPSAKYWKLREWLLPPWFISCQVLMIASLIISITTIIMAMVVMLHFCPVLNHEYHQTFTIFFASALSFAKVFFIFVVATIFGRLSEDWEWMPRPDWNFLSWGYGFLIISGIGSIAAGTFYFLQGREAHNKLQEKEDEFYEIAKNMAASQPQLSYQIDEDYSQGYPEKNPNEFPGGPDNFYPDPNFPPPQERFAGYNQSNDNQQYDPNYAAPEFDQQQYGAPKYSDVPQQYGRQF